MKGWPALRYQWFKDFQVWLFIMLTLLIFQFILILSFKEQLYIDSGFTDVLLAVAMGSRFDAATAAALILLFFFASITTSFISWGQQLHKLRLWFLTGYIIFVTILCGIDIVFFYEYGDQFNQTIFGIADDDTKAILITIWKEYHPIRFIIFVSLAIFSLKYLAHKWMSFTPVLITQKNSFFKLSENILVRTLVIATIFLAFIFVARGSTLSTQPLRQHHAFISKDIFLNKTILNPVTALRYAIQKRMWMQGDDALSGIWPEKDLRQALKLVSGRETDNIDTALSHIVVKENKTRPKHVFLILLESHSGWPIWPEYRDMNLSPQLSALADQGIYFQYFVPSGTGTMPSLNALFTGFPYSGLNVNYEPLGLKTFPSSVAATFKRMGYRTRFYYGGFLGWQRIDNFAKAQGFDEIYGAANIPSDKPENEWGVDDEYLYKFIKTNLNKDVPSFNIILTTSNHPPYDLNLDKIGFTGHKLRNDIKETKTDSLITLGHLWYTDQQAGKFVKEMNGLLDKSLFAITGDHTSRLKLKFPGQNTFQHISVPLILYGPKISLKAAAPVTAGSHIDILPTLYSLAAPAGFQYNTLGRNLLDDTIKSPAIGPGYAVNNGVLYIGNQTFPLYSGAADTQDKTDINRYSRAAQAISWYRVRNGAHIKQ